MYVEMNFFEWQKLKVEKAEHEKSKEVLAMEMECAADSSAPSKDRMAVDWSWENVSILIEDAA